MTTAKSGSQLKAVQEQRNGTVSLMPSLICLALNSTTNNINQKQISLTLTFPVDFHPQMKTVDHRAPHMWIIFAAMKSRRQKILRGVHTEHQISADKIFSSFANLLLLPRVHYTTSHKSQKYSLGLKRRLCVKKKKITKPECENINHIL